MKLIAIRLSKTPLLHTHKKNAWKKHEILPLKRVQILGGGGANLVITQRFF